MKKGNFLNSMIGSKLSKVLFTTAIASLGFCFTAFGQDDNDPSDIIKAEEESDVGKLWFGVRTGVTMSSFGNNTSSFNLTDGTGTLNSFTGGIFARYQALEWLAIQPEVSYLQTGANNLSYTKTTRTENAFGGGTGSFERDATARDLLNTVDASLNFVFTPKKFLPKLKPYMVLGTSYGFIINAIRRENDIIRGVANNYNVTNTIDVTSNYRVFDFAINYGVGSQFNVFGNTGFVELRYRWGISNISNYPMNNFPSENDITAGLPLATTRRSFAPQDLTNHTFMINLGYMFGGKAKKKGEEEATATEE